MEETEMNQLIDEQEEKIATLIENAADMAQKLTDARMDLIQVTAELNAARTEIETLKAQLHRAELAAEGWKPAGEPPDDNRDVMVRFPDAREAVGWWSPILSAWRENIGNDQWICFDFTNPQAIPPVAWKELE